MKWMAIDRFHFNKENNKWENYNSHTPALKLIKYENVKIVYGDDERDHLNTKIDDDDECNRNKSILIKIYTQFSSA